MFREGFGRHHRDFSSAWTLFKGLFSIGVVYPLPSFFVKSTIKIPNIVPEAEIFSC